MAVDFTPTLVGYSEQKELKFWCQKVLPLVYDDSLSYYEVLNKVVNYINNILEDLETLEQEVEELQAQIEELQGDDGSG